MRILSAALSLSLVASGALAAEKQPYVSSKLDTGLELLAMESHKVPLATIVLSCKAGGMNQTPQTDGLVHLWEHMFFKGNKRIPNQEAFNRRIRELGISFNGDTAAEKVRYFFTLPSVFLDDGLQFMSDAIESPLLEQQELEKERRVVLDEYDRAAAHPSFDFGNLERNYIYGKEEYQRDPLGYRPIIIGATREQLLKIKDEVFVPGNCSLLVSGDYKPDQLTALAKKHFDNWKNPAGWKPVVRPAFPPFPKSVEFIMTRPHVQNASVQVVFDGPKARTQQEDSFAADALNQLLEHRSGKFYKKFEDSGLTFSAGLSYYTQSQAGQVDLFAEMLPENAVKVRKMLLDEPKEWLNPDYFTAEQLEDVRRNLLINHKREVNQPSEFIKSLAFWWAVTGMDYYDGYLDNLKKTGFEQVRSFVKKYLIDKPHMAGILMSPEDAKKAKLKDDSKPLVDKYLAKYASSATPKKTPKGSFK